MAGSPTRFLGPMQGIARARRLPASDVGSARWRVERAAGTVRLTGIFRTPEADSIAAAIREATGNDALELDLGGVEQLDGGVVALVLADHAPDRRVALRNGERFQPLFDLYATGTPLHPHRPEPVNVAARVGLGTLHEVAELDRLVGFIGETALATARLLRRPARGHWKAIPLLVERAGMDALPIVLILNFLVGFVMAYMSARALSMFGANAFVADLVGIVMTRQLAPLMTAIIVCGRSGAAFAAELGSMKVAEEIDALRTLGLDPVAWLVLPRVLALVLVLPVLTTLADLMGILGGLLVAVLSLGLTPKGYFVQTRTALVPWDVQSGIWMSLAFAIAIGFIACQQGLAAAGGAQGVGRRTTTTVVSSLFAIVVLDALFTILYRVLGLS